MATIELTDDEALVFVDFLLRFTHDEALTIQHQAEERVLWDLGCLLEKQVPELFCTDYQARLDKARARVADD